MKRLPTLLVLSLSLISALPSRADDVQQLLGQAQTEYLRGDLAEAKRDFQLVLQENPHNVVAANSLRMININLAKAGPSNPQEKQLSTLIVPKVEFKEATLDSVFDYLKKTAAKLSNDKIAVNIVPQLSDEQRSQPVTLSLSNVPFTEVMKYVGTLAKVRFVFEPYAISVKPLSGALASDTTEPKPQ
jgi:hypothetical protein